MKPYDRQPKWKESSALKRLQDCLLMLCLHEFITESEMRKVRRRIEKWIRNSGVDRK